MYSDLTLEERKEVTAIRKDLTAFFNKIKFDEPSHSYTINGKKLEATSYFIHRYKPHFDSEKISALVAQKQGRTQEEVKEEWEKIKNDSCTLGTAIHLFGEDYVNSNFTLEPKNEFEKAIVAFWDTKPKHIVPVKLELQMYSEEFGIAGTADIICYNLKTKKLKILDYKGLDINTLIPTVEGFKKMGDLTLSDKVFDKDGKPCNIKNISDIHHKKCYKIVLDNKEEITSDFEHRWLVAIVKRKIKYINKKRYDYSVVEEHIMTTEEIFNYLNSPNYKRKCDKILKIFNTKPLELPNIELPIDPYVLGVWLGDGHSADSKITQANEKVWEEIERRGYTLGNDVSQNGSGKAQTRTIFGMLKDLRNLNLIKNKHLPDLYLFSSYEQRLDVLRGLMDSDGYFHKKRRRFVMNTSKKWQSEAIKKLVSSLGFKATEIETTNYLNGRKFEGWNCNFNTDGTNPFLCRNQDIEINVTTESNYKNIVSCELVDTIPTKCIEVDSESHTYLYGTGFTVTHNTNKDLFKNYKEQKMLPPFNKFLDCSFNMYKLQLSMYQYFLEQTGYEVESRTLIWLKPDGTYETHKIESVKDALLEEMIKYKNQ